MTSPVEYVECIAKKCNEKAPKGRLHCDFHLEMFKPKYKEYKRITNRIQKYIDEPKLIDNLEKEDRRMIATSLRHAACLRKEFQQNAIRPNKRDRGHCEIIEKMLALSQDILSKLDCTLEEYEDEEPNIEDLTSSSDTDCKDEPLIIEDNSIDRLFELGVRENYEAMSKSLILVYDIIKELEDVSGWKIKQNSIEVFALINFNIVASAIKSIMRHKHQGVVVQIVIDMAGYIKAVNAIKSTPELLWSEYVAITLSKGDVPNPKDILNANSSNRTMILRVINSIIAGLRVMGTKFVCNISYGNELNIELDRTSEIKKTGNIVYSRHLIPGISNSLCLKLT